MRSQQGCVQRRGLGLPWQIPWPRSANSFRPIGRPCGANAADDPDDGARPATWVDRAATATAGHLSVQAAAEVPPLPDGEQSPAAAEAIPGPRRP